MRHFFLSLFLAAFVFTSVAAHKSSKSFSDCIPFLENLITVTGSVTSLAEKDEGGLINKASEAKNLYSIGKTEDALQKLQDYQTKLDQLEATLSTSKPKISALDEQTLQTALNEAIACVSGT
jgi:hypothetical protein